MENQLQTLEDITRIEYHGEPVLTTEQLAVAYECTPDNIHDNFRKNRERFVESKHYFKVEGEDLKDLRPENFRLQISEKTRCLYLWTKRGAARHAKMLSTDKAWEVFEALEDNYFNRHDLNSADKKFWASLELDRERLALEHERLAFEHERLAFDREKFNWEREYTHERLGFDRERLLLDREQFEDATTRRAKLLERAGLFRELASAAKDNFLRDDLIRHAATLLSDKVFGSKF